jgi:hypothetical protein
MDISNIKFGYCDIFHNQIDAVIKMLEEHNTVKYLVGMETCDKHDRTNGEHMHFILHINPTDFKNLREKMRRTFNLGSKNNKNNKPYYGWMLQDIKNLERLKSYTLKDNNIRSKGYSAEELEEIIANSFEKKDERNLYKECIEAIHQQKPFINVRNDASSLYLDTTALEVFILKWHMEQGVKVCKSKIKNISISYLQLEYDKRYENLEEIYYYIMK